MLLHELNDTQARAMLGALRAVAECTGGEHATERALLAASAKAVGFQGELASVAAADPDDVKAAFTEPDHRTRVVQCMILMALMDGAASRDEAALIERYASALGVDEARVRNLRQLAEGRVVRMGLDLARRSFARDEFLEALAAEGPRGLWRIVGPLVGRAADYELARRFIAMGALPEGTLGRAYFDFVRRHEFAFPGEPYGVAERGVWHDLSHVLSGYETDPDGEVQVVSFIAGYRRDDPFFWLFTIAIQFHLGIKLSPYSPGGKTGHFDPARVARAYERGRAMTVDLSDHWDYWPLMDRPLAEVRARLNVPPP